ncbi:MAG: hypothetical protein ABI882_17905 [Acidobacteriota bacterium]
MDLPLSTFGFKTTPALTGGDVFLLPQQVRMTINSQPVDAATFFSVGNSTFGATPSQLGGFPGTSLQGVSAAIPGSAVRLIGCTDRLRSINFSIASSSSAGDQVVLFARNAAGAPLSTLATFLVEPNGVRLVGISVDARLFRASRMATGSEVTQGQLVSLSNAAGTAGSRTDLLTLRLNEANDSPLATCTKLGLDILRGNAIGKTSFVFTDLTVLRMEQEGDRDRTNTGLVAGLDGGYPTSAPCLAGCQPCPVGNLAVASSASFNSVSIAPDSLASIFGIGLASTTQSTGQVPLPTMLGGTTVRIRDSAGVEHLAQLLFVSPGQINYVVPAATALGLAMVLVTDGEGNVSTGSVLISSIAPGLFSANADGQGVAAAYIVRVRNGIQTIEDAVRYDAVLAKFVPVPISLGPVGDQVFLILFGTGFRRFQSLSDISVKIGGASMFVSGAAAQGSFVGLDQINVLLSRSLIGSGLVNVELSVAGLGSNVVTIQTN